MRFGSRAFLAGGLGFAAAFATACGGSTGLLSGDQANTLSTQLGAVSTAVNAHNCQAATSAAASFTSAVGHLPASVSNKLVQSLGDGAVTVQQLAARDCSSSSSSSSTTSTGSTPSTSTSVTTVTQTRSTSSTTQSQSSTATNPPGPGTSTTTNGGASLGTGTGDNGNGNGNNNGGNGNGNGGTGQ
jgi:hypothetical protein